MTDDGFLPLLLGNRLLSSLIVIAVVLLGRFVAARVIRGREIILRENQRLWLARVRNVSVMLILFGLVLIWLPALHTFALSITAFAVALVIATKELILCLSGTVLRTINRPFEVGDWIEIGDLRGEVVDETLLATTLEEVGGPVGRFEYSGNTITVPNSAFLTTPVRNRNFHKRWVFLEVDVVMESDVDMLSAIPAIEQEVSTLFEPHAELATRYTEKIEKSSGIDIADPQPRVMLSSTEVGKQRITVTLFCPRTEAYAMERAINAVVLTHYWRGRSEAPSKRKRPAVPEH